MKTLADLKRDLNKGDRLVMTFNAMEGSSERIKQFIGVERYIVAKNTTGVKLSLNKDDTKGSFLDYPKKATLCEYDGETLKIYDAGFRELTADEKRVKDNVPSSRKENKEAVMQEIMTDGSGFYWKDKQYYKENEMEYLAGHESFRGLRYHYNTGMIEDESIKGNLSLAYKIIK